MDLSEQEIQDINNGIDGLSQEQLDQIINKRADTLISPAEFSKWLIKKLNDWL